MSQMCINLALRHTGQRTALVKYKICSVHYNNNNNNKYEIYIAP